LDLNCKVWKTFVPECASSNRQWVIALKNVHRLQQLGESMNANFVGHQQTHHFLRTVDHKVAAPKMKILISFYLSQNISFLLPTFRFPPRHAGSAPVG